MNHSHTHTLRQNMDVEVVFHMKEGVGEKSYTKNSSLQKKVISKAQPFVHKVVGEFYSKTFPQRITIADLGCSSGNNSLIVMSDIIDAIDELRLMFDRPSPEIQVFLNDLPGNDFNTIFLSTPYFYESLRKGKGEDFAPCFVAGVPGSFYGRLFPSRTLNLVHSSYCLHWLSQVPRGIANNKGNIYIAKTSPPNVIKAYSEQFNRDFSVFLSSRSKEMIPGGRMVVTMIGRRSSDHFSKEWEVFSESISDMVLEGDIEEAKYDAFNLPYYTPHVEEVKAVIQSEGSFVLDRVETFDTDFCDYDDSVYDSIKSEKFVANTIRAVLESMVASHFGESTTDKLFCKYEEHVAEIPEKEKIKNYNLVIGMTNNDHSD